MASHKPTKRERITCKPARKKPAGKKAHATSPAKRAPRKVAREVLPPRAAAKPERAGRPTRSAGAAAKPERAGRPTRSAGAAAPAAAEVEVADLLREANETLNALLALEPMVAPEDTGKYLRARNEARRARFTLENAQFKALLDEQKAALPELVDRTRQLKQDLENAQDAVATVNAISAALGLFADILKLLPALA